MDKCLLDGYSTAARKATRTMTERLERYNLQSMTSTGVSMAGLFGTLEFLKTCRDTGLKMEINNYQEIEDILTGLPFIERVSRAYWKLKERR